MREAADGLGRQQACFVYYNTTLVHPRRPILASIYGLVSPALRVSRHTRLISAAEVAEGPQPYRVPCTLPFYYTILYYRRAQRTEWVDVVVPAGVETGKKSSFEYGGVLYKVRAAVAAGQTMRLPALTFVDEGGGAAAEAETAAVAGAVTGAGAGAGAAQVASFTLL